jgi:hypothetical protein
MFRIPVVLVQGKSEIHAKFFSGPICSIITISYVKLFVCNKEYDGILAQLEGEGSSKYHHEAFGGYLTLSG